MNLSDRKKKAAPPPPPIAKAESVSNIAKASSSSIAETEPAPKTEKPPPPPVVIPESETEKASPVVIASQPIEKPGKSSKRNSLKPTLKPSHQTQKKTNSPAPTKNPSYNRLSITPADLIAQKHNLISLSLLEGTPRKSPKIQARLFALNQINRTQNSHKILSISKHNPLVILKPRNKDLEQFSFKNSVNTFPERNLESNNLTPAACIEQFESVFKNDDELKKIFEENDEITLSQNQFERNRKNSSDSEDSYESVVFVGGTKNMMESKTDLERPEQNETKTAFLNREEDSARLISSSNGNDMFRNNKMVAPPCPEESPPSCCPSKVFPCNYFQSCSKKKNIPKASFGSIDQKTLFNCVHNIEEVSKKIGNNNQQTLIENLEAFPNPVYPNEICNKIANFEKIIKSTPQKDVNNICHLKGTGAPQVSTPKRCVSSNISLKVHNFEHIEASSTKVMDKKAVKNAFDLSSKRADSLGRRNETIKCLIHNKHEALLDANIPAMFIVPEADFERVDGKAKITFPGQYKSSITRKSRDHSLKPHVTAEFKVNKDVFRKKTQHLSPRCEKSELCPKLSPSKSLFEISLFQKPKDTKIMGHPQKLILLQDIYKEDAISISDTSNESIIEVKLTPNENLNEPTKKSSKTLKIRDKIQKLSPFKKQKVPRAPSPIPDTKQKMATTRNFPNRKLTEGQNIDWSCHTGTSSDYIKKITNISSRKNFLSKLNKNVDNNRAGEFV